MRDMLFTRDVLQGPGLLTRAMSVDVLTSNYKAPEVCDVSRVTCDV